MALFSLVELSSSFSSSGYEKSGFGATKQKMFRGKERGRTFSSYPQRTTYYNSTKRLSLEQSAQITSS